MIPLLWVAARYGSSSANREALTMPSIVCSPLVFLAATASAGTRHVARTRRRSQRFDRIRKPSLPSANFATSSPIASAMVLTMFAPMASRQSVNTWTTSMSGANTRTSRSRGPPPSETSWATDPEAWSSRTRLAAMIRSWAIAMFLTS